MFAVLAKTVAAFPAIAILLGLCVLAGCQAVGGGGEGEISPPAVLWDADRTLDSGEGYPISMVKRAPRDVQELVNRNHAVVIGTISAISDLEPELPYGKTEEDFQDPKYQGYVPRTEVTYYDIAIEEALLDDGNVRAHSRLRLSGAHNPGRPQVGERFLFCLGRNPDSLSYGVVADWDVLTLEGGVRNFDGTLPGYAGVTDEDSLVAAVRAAVAGYEFIPFNQWPDRFAAN